MAPRTTKEEVSLSQIGLTEKTAGMAPDAATPSSVSLPRIIWGVLLSFLLIIVIVLVVVGSLGMFNPVESDPGCKECQFLSDDWRTADEKSYSANSCGEEVFVENDASSNTFTVMGKNPSADKLSEKIKSANIAIIQNTITLDWIASGTVKSNETLKLVFSDSGSQYGGLGGFDQALFKDKPATGSSSKYTMWTKQDEPWYLPFYLSRTGDAAICILLDIEGAPFEVTVRETSTEWLLYRVDDIKLYIYSGSSAFAALELCVAKSAELYPPSPEALWTDDIILGSLTMDEIDSAKQINAIGTHYVLSSESLSLKDGAIVVLNPDAADLQDIIYSWEAGQTDTSDSLDGLTEENGYYRIDNKTLILDYQNPAIKSKISQSAATQNNAGFLLIDGYLPYESDECPKYLHCSSLNIAEASNMCLGTQFTDGPIFELHNTYDRSRSSALQTAANARMIESVANLGTVHFHRSSELSAAGLRSCLNNILNLHAVGVRAATCNLCGGVLPTEAGDIALCKRWSHLVLLMPYIIMTNDVTPPLPENDSLLQRTLTLRKQLTFFLSSAYASALKNKLPFVYPYSNKHFSEAATKSVAVVIGEEEKLVLVVLDGDDNQVIFPEGDWVSVLSFESVTNLTSDGSTASTINGDTLLENMLFFKASTIFVLADPVNPNELVVRIFLPHDDWEDNINYDFVYRDSVNKYTTTITANPVDKNISFKYKNTDLAVSNDLKVSTIELYLCLINDITPNDWIIKTALFGGQTYFNYKFNYTAKGDIGDRSIFSNWDQSIQSNGPA